MRGVRDVRPHAHPHANGRARQERVYSNYRPQHTYDELEEWDDVNDDDCGGCCGALSGCDGHVLTCAVALLLALVCGLAAAWLSIRLIAGGTGQHKQPLHGTNIYIRPPYPPHMPPMPPRPPPSPPAPPLPECVLNPRQQHYVLLGAAATHAAAWANMEQMASDFPHCSALQLTSHHSVRLYQGLDEGAAAGGAGHFHHLGTGVGVTGGHAVSQPDGSGPANGTGSGEHATGTSGSGRSGSLSLAAGGRHVVSGSTGGGSLNGWSGGAKEASSSTGGSSGGSGKSGTTGSSSSTGSSGGGSGSSRSSGPSLPAFLHELGLLLPCKASACSLTQQLTFRRALHAAAHGMLSHYCSLPPDVTLRPAPTLHNASGHNVTHNGTGGWDPQGTHSNHTTINATGHAVNGTASATRNSSNTMGGWDPTGNLLLSPNSTGNSTRHEGGGGGGGGHKLLRVLWRLVSRRHAQETHSSGSSSSSRNSSSSSSSGSSSAATHAPSPAGAGVTQPTAHPHSRDPSSNHPHGHLSAQVIPEAARLPPASQHIASQLRRLLGEHITPQGAGVHCRWDPTLPHLPGVLRLAPDDHRWSEEAAVAAAEVAAAQNATGRYLIAFNLYNSAHIMPQFILQALALATYLPPGSVMVSCYESGSEDTTPEWLGVMQRLLDMAGIPSKIVIRGALIRMPQLSRIGHLSLLRNAAIAPLTHAADCEAAVARVEPVPSAAGTRTSPSPSSSSSGSSVPALQYSCDNGFPATKLLFLNDVYFCWQDVVRLVSHDVDIACGLDLDAPGMPKAAEPLVEAWVHLGTPDAAARLQQAAEAVKRNVQKEADLGAFQASVAAAQVMQLEAQRAAIAALASHNKKNSQAQQAAPGGGVTLDSKQHMSDSVMQDMLARLAEHRSTFVTTSTTAASSSTVGMPGGRRHLSEPGPQAAHAPAAGSTHATAAAARVPEGRVSSGGWRTGRWKDGGGRGAGVEVEAVRRNDTLRGVTTAMPVDGWEDVSWVHPWWRPRLLVSSSSRSSSSHATWAAPAGLQGSQSVGAGPGGHRGRVLAGAVDVSQAQYMYYDIWVGRDIKGNRMEKGHPIMKDEGSMARVRRGHPTPVQCCWNGLVVLNAAPFRQRLPTQSTTAPVPPPAQAASSNVSTLPLLTFHEGRGGEECKASECSLLCNDFWRRGARRVLLDPYVRVTYLPYFRTQLHDRLMGGVPMLMWAELQAQPGGPGSASELAQLWRSNATAPPHGVDCCPINDRNFVDFGECSKKAGWMGPGV